MVKTSFSDVGSGGLISGWGAKVPTCFMVKKPKQTKKNDRYPNEMVVYANKFCGSLLFHGST